jgi:hypothetical protein
MVEGGRHPNVISDTSVNLNQKQILNAQVSHGSGGRSPVTSQTTQTPGVASTLGSSRRHRMPPPVPRSVVHFGLARCNSAAPLDALG